MSARSSACAILALVLIVVGWPAAARANVPLTRVSTDPFDNSTSQHATELEPDTFAYGGTVVAAFQVGRFFNAGATDIGYVRSGDGGASWDTPGFLPGMTVSAGVSNSPFERVSDPSVAYDAEHHTWLISSIPITSTIVTPTIFVNLSVDDGRTWGPPVSIPPPAANKIDLDKNWTVCDNGSASPFRGTCYTEFDNGLTGVLYMSTSHDGGQHWSVPISGARHKGIGGQPVVQPDGTVVVPYESWNGKIEAVASFDGGASWTTGVEVAHVRFHRVAGGLRTSPLPSAEIDSAGRVYVAWEDCRFRAKCAANDIVFATSADALHWTAPRRIPIDPVGSGVDHFIPGLAVDPTRHGATAHLALTYYFYPDATCAGGCRLQVGYISSPDGGRHWSDAVTLAGPMSLNNIAQTSQGPMVGDYISTSFSGPTATTVFAIGKPTGAAAYDEAMYAPAAPLAVATAAQATHRATSAGALSGLTGVGTGETHHALRDD